ncbi:hypothetical protein D3C86_1255700 [compost metagenome]
MIELPVTNVFFGQMQEDVAGIAAGAAQLDGPFQLFGKPFRQSQRRDGVVFIGEAVTGEADLLVFERITQLRTIKHDLAIEPEAGTQRNCAQPVGVGEIIGVISNAGLIGDIVLIGFFTRPRAAGAGKAENKRDISPQPHSHLRSLIKQYLIFGWLIKSPRRFTFVTEIQCANTGIEVADSIRRYVKFY